MNGIARRIVLGVLLSLPCAGARAQMHEEPGLDDVALSGTTPESIILQWPTYSYRLARFMISKYGQPAQSSDARLVWVNAGPWKRSVVYRGPVDGGARLEQEIDFDVAEDERGELLLFAREAGLSLESGRLVAASNAESDNFLAVNLADEIVRGKRTAKEASDFRRQLLRLQDSGKSSPYLERLLFGPERPSGREIPPAP